MGGGYKWAGEVWKPGKEGEFPPFPPPSNPHPYSAPPTAG